MATEALYGVQVEIHPYPLKNKNIEKEWEKILLKLNKTYKDAKTSNLPNYFWFKTEVDAIEFTKKWWLLQMSDPSFTIKVSLQFPSPYKEGDDNESSWIDVDETTLFLLSTTYKDEFNAGLLAPFQHKNIDSFLMEQDVWKLQMIGSFEQRNGRQWLNVLDESDRREHQSTYVGEILFYINRKNWEFSVNKNPGRTDEYFLVRDIADGDRYTFTSVRAVGLTTGIEKILSMEELYIRRSPLMLKPGITRYFFDEMYKFLLDQIEDEIENEHSWPLNVYLWFEWESDKKIELLSEAYRLFIQGIVLSENIDSEEIDAAVAAIFIHVKESVVAEIEDVGNDNLSTYWRSLILNVFNQVHSSDKQSEIVRETLATETSERSELIEPLAIWYFNEYPITIYSKAKDKWGNVVYYLADKLCGVDISEFEDYYEYEEVETGILEN